MKNEDRIVELLAELIVEVQGVRTEQAGMRAEQAGMRAEQAGMRAEQKATNERIDQLASEVVKLREDVNRNHAKAMAGIGEVRTSVVHLDEYITKLLTMEERINKLETAVYGKTG
ncbi:MAG: hypothetical protein H7Z75_03570 [Ferruginibacter sp.]|nr:hypothetical protein [Cytophagales bacterium]